MTKKLTEQYIRSLGDHNGHATLYACFQEAKPYISDTSARPNVRRWAKNRLATCRKIAKTLNYAIE
jgi:hypothetical protein